MNVKYFSRIVKILLKIKKWAKTAAANPEEIFSYLCENVILISEIKTAKIGSEEYYIYSINGNERG